MVQRRFLWAIGVHWERAGRREARDFWSSNGSGTYNTDYWTVTERDGTSYMFGRNELPGWASGKATTNSVDSMPVYSAHSGDPCYSSSGFTSSVCTMAYKWHLDYVTDAHAGAMSYYYTQATNYYGQDKGAKNTSYVRDSYLSRIDYGFLAGGAYATVPDQVAFTTATRCTATTCDPLSTSTAASQYPDVPYDLNCASGATCSEYSPSGVVNLSGELPGEGTPGCAGAGGQLRAQGAAGRPVTPVICFQMAKRWVISVRWSGAVIRWRRGRKWGEMPLNADRNRWAPPTLRKPFIARSRCLVGW
jgi:hypothetical protein